MKLSSPKQVFDLDNFLPQDGESKFEMGYLNGVLTVDVFYEKDGVVGEAKRTISFVQAKYFFKTPFPGYSFFTCPDDKNLSLLNSLVEYEQSDMLKVEEGASGNKSHKHFRLFLHSAGAAIHVIARSCEMSSEMLSAQR